jgi:hypothetical protein
MPTMQNLSVESLHLDLKNYRTVPQEKENDAINALITIDPDWFWPLMDSLLEDGYHPTENIIVLQSDGEYIVREGNRRIAALKIIFGYVKDIDIPDSYNRRIQAITDDWKQENKQVPCTIYEQKESKIVDKIISRIHAKGEKAGRRTWNAVARARYQRDEKGKSEPGLDLLEKYLVNGKNFTTTQAERWSGDYNLTVLNEAIQKICAPLGYNSSKDLSQIYPKKNKRAIDKILYDIGVEKIGFKNIRNKDRFFGIGYGIKPPVAASSGSTSTSSSSQTETDISGSSTSSQPVATASNDPISVYKKLKAFKPRGKNREKLVTLLNEINLLKLNRHPHSFCFLLRSMFEISAKAYCADYKSSGGPSYLKKDGTNKSLADILKEITKYITKNNSDKEKVKELHGAITELAKPEGLLSVTSMNQLVHNPSFSIQPSDISILFGNIFPLLEEMNK